MSTKQPAAWSTLLNEAVTKPGTLSAAYRAFHSYSLGNQLLAAFQCAGRGIPLGPIATYKGWQAKGRQVKRGEKALTLCMPVTVKKQDADEASDPEYLTAFVYKPRWFVLAQTDGPDHFEPEHLPDWHLSLALDALDVTLADFTHPDGNCQGYASKRSIAINPVAALPEKTTFHELAHVVLGHTTEGEHSDGEHLPRSLREVEAEGVAYVLCSVLDLAGAESARAYIQSWLDGASIPERSAQRILTAAQTILEAGQQEQAA